MVKLLWFHKQLFIINIEYDSLILNDGDVRIVDAGKSIKAFRPLFLCPGSGDRRAAENDIHTVCTIITGESDAVQQVRPCISYGKIDGSLRTRDNNGLAVILYQIRQCRRCIGHGIRSMTDHKSVKSAVILLNDLLQLKPVFLSDIGAVQIERLNHFDFTKLFRFRNIGKKLFRRDLGGQSAVC